MLCAPSHRMNSVAKITKDTFIYVDRLKSVVVNKKYSVVNLGGEFIR
jgi:tryptophanase